MKSIVKISFVLLTTLALTMCNTKQNDQKSTTQPTENFDWLLGNWKRTNEEKGKETFENWKKTNDTEYKGIGFTLQIAGQRKARADHTAIILSLEAVFAMLGGMLILQEKMSGREFFGAGLMLCGVIIAQYYPQKPSKKVTKV